jgi:hypothetical protein
MSPDKKKRDPVGDFLIMQYIRTFLLFAALIVIAYAISQVGK